MKAMTAVKVVSSGETYLRPTISSLVVKKLLEKKDSRGALSAGILSTHRAKPCSKCGWVREDLTLSDGTFYCESCGHTADRDDNASDNILLLAVSSTERVNGRGGDVRPLGSERRTPGKRQSEMAHLSSF